MKVSATQNVRVFEIAQNQSTACNIDIRSTEQIESSTACNIAIQSTELIESDTHITNLHYGNNLFNFRLEIQDTIQKVHLLQLYRSNYKYSIVSRPYEPDELVFGRDQGESDEVTLDDNHEVEFDFPDFQRMYPFPHASLSTNVKEERINYFRRLAIILSESFWLGASIR